MLKALEWGRGTHSVEHLPSMLKAQVPGPKIRWREKSICLKLFLLGMPGSSSSRLTFHFCLARGINLPVFKKSKIQTVNYALTSLKSDGISSASSSWRKGILFLNLYMALKRFPVAREPPAPTSPGAGIPDVHHYAKFCVESRNWLATFHSPAAIREAYSSLAWTPPVLWELFIGTKLMAVISIPSTKSNLSLGRVVHSSNS